MSRSLTANILNVSTTRIRHFQRSWRAKSIDRRTFEADPIHRNHGRRWSFASGTFYSVESWRDLSSFSRPTARATWTRGALSDRLRSYCQSWGTEFSGQWNETVTPARLLDRMPTADRTLAACKWKCRPGPILCTLKRARFACTHACLLLEIRHACLCCHSELV